MWGNRTGQVWEIPTSRCRGFPHGPEALYLGSMSEPADGGHQKEVRRYYRTVSRFIDRELIGRGDRRFWEEVVAETSRPRTLELGAGTGRITALLAQGSSRLVAVDLSLAMLRKARTRLGGHHRVGLVAMDMRRLGLEARFDLVVAADDPFVHLLEDEDRARALDTVARHLDPGGRFVLDAYRLPPEAARKARRPGGYRRERRAGGPEGRLTVRETWEGEAETHRYRARYEYLEEGARVGEASFRARLWSQAELRERLPRCGLEIRRLWGGFDRRPWDPETARHLIVEAVPAS